MLYSVTHIKKSLCHWVHHCWWKASFGYVLFCLLQGFCNIYWLSSKSDLEFIPYAQMVSLHVTGWGGRTSSFNFSWGAAQILYKPNNNPTQNTLLKQTKKLQQNYSAFRPIRWSRESIKAYLQSHILVLWYVWTITHVVSALLVSNLVYVLKHSSILQGNVTHKHTQPKKVMTSGINFVSSGWVLDLKSLKPALQNVKSKRPQNRFMPFPIHNFIACELSNS